METLWNSPNYVDKISFIAQWAVLISGIIALIFTLRSTTLKDRASELKEKADIEIRMALENKIKFANTELNNTKNELEKIKPRPLSERMRNILNSIDSKIIPALKSGRTGFEGGVSSSQFNELQKVSKEPGASRYINISSDVRMGIGMGPEGVTYGVTFTLNPQLLNE